MKKVFMNWKLYFILGLLAFCMIFIVEQAYVSMKQPNPEWSRQITIAKVSNDIIKGSTRIRVNTVSFEAQKKFYVFWIQNESLCRAEVDKNGTVGTITSTDLAFDEPQNMLACREGSKAALYVMESGKLLKTEFDPATGVYTKPVTIEDKVTNLKIYDQKLFVATENICYMIDQNGGKTVLINSGAECLDVIATKNAAQNYAITYAMTDKAGTIHVNYGVYDNGTKKTRVYELGNFITSVNEMQSMESLLIGYGIDSDLIHVLAPFKNLKSNSTRMVDFSFVDNGSELKDKKDVTLVELDNYNPDPVRISDGSQGQPLRLTAAVKLIKGSKTETYNIRMFEYKNNQLVAGELLTNMNNLSMNQHYFKLAGQEYLQWEHNDGSSTKILFASTDAAAIKLGSKIDIVDLRNVILDAMMALGFALSYMILIFSCIMLPTLILVVTAAMFGLTWVEQHTRIATYVSVAVHVGAEFILAANSILKKPTVLSSMPSWLQGSAGIYGMILLSAGICFFCLRLKYKDGNLDKSFMNQYAFFAIINMVLYALIFFPYYYL